MKKVAALTWLLLFSVGCLYLGWRVHEGLAFRTDLMALLPREERDPELQKINDTVVRNLSRKMVIMVGHPDADVARTAATKIAAALMAADLVELTNAGMDIDHFKKLAELYGRYRSGILSEGDRQKLEAGQGSLIADRSLAEVYGGVAFDDARLLKIDPFLLLPNYFLHLPVPLSRLKLDHGVLTATENGMTWVMIASQLKGEPFALDLQKRLNETLDKAVTEAETQPGLKILHLGAVFFAEAGAREAMHETSTIGLLSTLITLLLIVVVFRSIGPLIFSFLVIATGVITALAVSLAIFGELHVGSLLFGVSLIGVSVDYSLQYCTEVFVRTDRAGAALGDERLRRVLIGVSIGTTTTVIGYLTFLLAPFPGLHQIAVFSAVGLIASWLTVVLWLPRLDRTPPATHGKVLLAASGGYFNAWLEPRFEKRRMGLFGVPLVVVLVGLFELKSDDNVKHLQSLDPTLAEEQKHIQDLIGRSEDNQFFLIEAKNDEEILQREEGLIDHLRPLVERGTVTGFDALAEYIPSVKRQTENRALIKAQLYDPMLLDQAKKLTLSETPSIPDPNAPFLTPEILESAGGASAGLSALHLENEGGDTMHVVMLEGIKDLKPLRELAESSEGVRFIDPTGDFSNLLGKYRARALGLLILSASLMLPVILWRYGVRRGFRVMAPPLMAVALAPALRGLAGGSFTFFDAMALVLILSIGVDYTVFCAETTTDRKPVTMLAVTLAAATALLSFGLLGFSQVLAVHNFGLTMFWGISVAFVLAPLARERSSGEH